MNNNLFNTSVLDSSQNKSNGFKTGLFLLIVLLISGGLIYGAFYIFFKNNDDVSINGNDTTIITKTNYIKSYCDNVSIEDFLKHFSLDESNINFIASSTKDNYVYNNYNLVYEGYILKNTNYLIIFKNNKVICSNGEDKTIDFPFITEIEENFNKVSNDELRSYLDYSVYDKFSLINKKKNLDEVTNFYKRLNLNSSELEKEINLVEDYYDAYKLEKNSNNEINYGKIAIKNAIENAYN